MRMQDCVKMLIELNRVEQKRLARWRGCTANTICAALKAQDMKCDTVCDILDFMGYEVIVREKGRTMRARDEILIDTGADGLTPHQIVVLKEEEAIAKAKEDYYLEKDKEIEESFPWGMRMRDLAFYFHRPGDLIHKYFDGYFRGKRVPLKYVKEIMRKYDL